MKRDTLIKASKDYFKPWESIHEANPQQILERFIARNVAS